MVRAIINAETSYFVFFICNFSEKALKSRVVIYQTMDQACIVVDPFNVIFTLLDHFTNVFEGLFVEVTFNKELILSSF